MIVDKKTFGVVHGHSARTSGYERAVPGRLEKDTGLSWLTSAHLSTVTCIMRPSSNLARSFTR